MHPDELAYYRERAFKEKRCASESTVRLAADIHLELAGHYEQLVEIEEQRAPRVRVVGIGNPLESDAASDPAQRDGSSVCE